MRIGSAALAILLLLPVAVSGESWKIQYFYDQLKEDLNISDFGCPSARRCIAIGAIAGEKGSPKSTAVVTSDGGAHWSLVPLKEAPLSMFLLDDSVGWIAGAKNLWKTVEGGRSWERVNKLPPGILRVYFLDEKHGWAMGAKKSVFETTDGGTAWNAVAAASEPRTNPEYTVYNWMAFVDKTHGVITGYSRPLRRDPAVPDWADPQAATTRRQWPTVSITLDSHDGGKTWTSSTASLFGQIARVRLSPAGVGLGLIEFSDAFDWPAEVFRIDWKTGRSARVFREHNQRITDVAIVSDNLGFLAGAEVPGKFQQNPIPGKLKIFKSTDLTSTDQSSWIPMEVDYRATAREALLSAADRENIWVATDTGMILKLTR